MRNIDFVIYTSKHCNLRCSYCYELPLLADRTRVTPEQATRLFERARAYLDLQDEPVLVRFQWHGGEPLLIPPDYYWTAFDNCRRVFEGSGHVVHHTVQSNLTVLDDARLDLLANGFTEVGVSLDVHSGLRVNGLGVDQEYRTVENLDRVLAAGVRPAGISVLSRPTLRHLRSLYRFYKERGMGFRVLPLERGLYEAGQPFELTASEILDGLCRLADIWFADDDPVRVEPIVEHIRMLVAAKARPDERIVHDKREWEPVLQVDTNGRLLGYTSIMDEDRSLGNVFTTPIDRILAGPEQAAAAAAAEARVGRTCGTCRFFGRGCTSYPIAECDSSILDRSTDGALDCSVVRPLLAHIEHRLVEGGVFDRHGNITNAMRAAQRAQGTHHDARAN